MKLTLSLFLAFIIYGASAQDLTGFTQVDKFKIDKFATTVYFKDPLKVLISQYPDFDSKDNQIKYELLSAYLRQNTLYIFKTTAKDGGTKYYELTGNPKKLRTKNYFKIDIFSSAGTIEKTVDKVNAGGSFFEHMAIFQTQEGKEAVGKGVQIWGYFVLVERYEGLKKVVTNLIKMDVENTLPDEMMAKEEKLIEPLFAYQSCGLKTVKKREFTITVYQYDSLRHVKNKYSRTEKDADLYYSSISNDLGGVTAFPFFSATDRKDTNGNIINVTSSLSNINHYLKDIRVTMRPNSNDIENIEAKLIIHSYSAKGQSSYDELYLLQFGKVGDCWLPKTVKYSPLEDIKFETPRIVTEINYVLK